MMFSNLRRKERNSKSAWANPLASLCLRDH